MRRVGLGPPPPVEKTTELLKWLREAVRQLGTASQITELPVAAPSADSFAVWDLDVNPNRVVWATIGTGLSYASGTIGLSHLGFESLTDPNADSIPFWDDSEGTFDWLGIGNGLAVAGGALVLTMGLGQCRLDYVGTTSIKLSRHNGKYILINGVLEEIPSAGVTLANTGLTASTLYYIYAYLSSGTMTLEASATAYATDSTYGHPIKSGDATRTLVGMVYMDTGTPGTFADTESARLVISYWNRKDTTVLGTKGTNTTTTSTSFTELSTTLRASFLHWGDEIIMASTRVIASSATANVSIFARVAFGVAVGTYASGTACSMTTVSAVANYITNGSAFGRYAPAAGFNTATLEGASGSGAVTATYNAGDHQYYLMIRK